MRLKGLYTAIITPFDERGELDEEGLRENIRFQIANDVDGIVALGTTGEAPTLSSEEKKKVVRITVDEGRKNKRRVQILIGTGSYCTKTAVEQTLFAKEAGADGALVVTPYYNKPTQEGLYRHFKEICEKTAFPICLYNIQGRTAQNLQTETLERLMEIPSLVAVKEGSGNIMQIGDVIAAGRKIRPDFSILSSDDAIALPLIALGGHGVISVVSNIVPKEMSALVHAALAGEFEKAQELHHTLLPLFKAAFIETNPIPIKTAMRLLGRPAGCLRLPLCDMSPQNTQLLKQIVWSSATLTSQNSTPATSSRR